MPQVCKNCGSSDIDNDSARGGSVCTNCGSVVEENVILSELEFAENAAGGASLIGQFVSADAERHSFGSALKYTGSDSRQAILDRGRATINQLGSQLRLGQHSLDAAFMFYKLAVTKRLTSGRRTIHVIGACIYLVCRTEQTAHLLIDICDATQTDIFTLGRTFLVLSRELCIEIPTIDPSLYIHRFASKLKFGEKENEVAMTALRLLSRMKRDWMATGRRPSGLCGAALLVAGKLHGFNTTMKDIIRVVRLSSTTISNRLTDFTKCPSSKLTIEEFKRVDLEEEMDPPSYTKGRHRVKQPQVYLDEEDLISVEALNRVDFTKTQIELYVEKRKEIKEELLSRQKLSQELKKKKAEDAAKDSSKKPKKNQAKSAVAATESCDGQESISEPSQPEHGSLSERRKHDEETGNDSSQEGRSGLDNNKDALNNPEGSDELDLEGLDDEELNDILLSTEETELKRKLWMEENGDFMIELKAREEQKEKEESEKKGKVKKHTKRPRKERAVAGSADEAIINMLTERKLSTKINYDVLKDLNSDTDTPSVPKKGRLDASAESKVSFLPARGTANFNFKRPSQYARKLQPKSQTAGRLSNVARSKLSQASGLSSQAVTVASGVVKEHKDQESQNALSSASVSSDEKSSSTIPLAETHVDQPEDDHEDDYYEDDEHDQAEQESEFSAAQLFAKDIGNEDDAAYDYDGYGDAESFY